MTLHYNAVYEYNEHFTHLPLFIALVYNTVYECNEDTNQHKLLS